MKSLFIYICLGDWPDIDVILDSSSGANLTDITVQEVTKGQISTTHFTLMSEDVPASPLPIGATTTQVRKYHDTQNKGNFYWWLV